MLANCYPKTCRLHSLLPFIITIYYYHSAHCVHLYVCLLWFYPLELLTIFVVFSQMRYMITHTPFSIVMLVACRVILVELHSNRPDTNTALVYDGEFQYSHIRSSVTEIFVALRRRKRSATDFDRLQHHRVAQCFHAIRSVSVTHCHISTLITPCCFRNIETVHESADTIHNSRRCSGLLYAISNLFC